MPDHSAASLSSVSDVLDRMQRKLQDFMDLLKEEQQAIRTLSFGQFSIVTEKKTGLLDEIREIESERRELTANRETGSRDMLFQKIEQKERRLADLIVATDHLNRFNADLIGQSLAFLTGSLRMWQQSPASAALYSHSGSMVTQTAHGIGVKG